MGEPGFAYGQEVCVESVPMLFPISGNVSNVALPSTARVQVDDLGHRFLASIIHYNLLETNLT